MIQAATLNEHIKICMLDERYRIQKQNQEQSENNRSTVGGMELQMNLKGMRNKRPDIFGVTTEDF